MSLKVSRRTKKIDQIVTNILKVPFKVSREIFLFVSFIPRKAGKYSAILLALASLYVLMNIPIEIFSRYLVHVTSHLV